MIGGSSIAGASIAGDASLMRTVVVRISPIDSNYDMPDVFAGGGASFLIEAIDSDFDMPDVVLGGGASSFIQPIDSDFDMPDLGIRGGASFLITPMDSVFDMPNVVVAGGASFLIEPIDSDFDMPDVEQMTVTFVGLEPIDSDFNMPDVFVAGGASFDLTPIDSDFDMPETDIVIIVRGVPDWYPQLVSGDAKIVIRNRENKTVEIERSDEFNTEFSTLTFVSADEYTDATVTDGRYKYKLRFVGRFDGQTIAEGQKSISKYVKV